MLPSLALLGATGSIGKSTLELLRCHKNVASPQLLTAHHQIDQLIKLVQEWHPKWVCVTGDELSSLQAQLIENEGCTLLHGSKSLLELIEAEAFDSTVLAVSGAAGLEYGLATLRKGGRLAIANKEPLVIAGELFKDIEKRHGGEIIPVDSEHSAILQCLQEHHSSDVERIILTSSGGPFHHRQDDFTKVHRDEALKHPTWNMGQKITIDSATMMNKALEMIEAKWLFDIPLDRIEVTVHRQSIVHSMVEFVDGSILSQMGITDMQFPIWYALSYPKRWPSALPRLSFAEKMQLSFEPVNPFLQQAIDLARDVGDHPLATICCNAANEIYVHAFLNEKVNFCEVYSHIRKVIDVGLAEMTSPSDLSDVLACDREARKISRHLLKLS